MSSTEHRQAPPEIKIIVLLVLTAGVLVQGLKLLRGVSLDIPRVIENIGQPAV